MLPPGNARNPHVLCVRTGCCALAVSKLAVTLTADARASES
ncbi:L-asparaginase [Lelliottia amnigena]|nr:L-asparaginase [Lelliottia amnigena]